MLLKVPELEKKCIKDYKLSSSSLGNFHSCMLYHALLSHNFANCQFSARNKPENNNTSVLGDKQM